MITTVQALTCDCNSLQVAEFFPSEVKPNQITFKWSLPPDEENGVLLGFKIKYGIKVRSVAFNYDCNYTLLTKKKLGFQVLVLYVNSCS